MTDFGKGGEETPNGERNIESPADARKRAGFTQDQLAEKLNVELSTVGRWERGTQEPQPWMRPKLAKCLGISADELATVLAKVSPVNDHRVVEAAILLADENQAAPYGIRSQSATTCEAHRLYKAIRITCRTATKKSSVG